MNSTLEEFIEVLERPMRRSDQVEDTRTPDEPGEDERPTLPGFIRGGNLLSWCDEYSSVVIDTSGVLPKWEAEGPNTCAIGEASSVELAAVFAFDSILAGIAELAKSVETARKAVA